MVTIRHGQVKEWGPGMTGERTIAEMARVATLDVTAMEAVAAFHRAAGALRTQAERRVLGAHRLTWTTWVVLQIVSVWQEIETRHVAQEAGISKSTLTGVVATLDRRGLIRRSVHPRDARRVLLTPTPAGNELVNELLPQINAEETAMLSGIPRDVLGVIIRTMRSLAERLEGQSERAPSATPRGMLTIPRWRGGRGRRSASRPTRPGDDRARQINDFWSWWQQHEGEYRDQLQAGQLSARLTGDLGRAVRAVHPDLVWEVGPGTSAELALVVSAGGVAELRALSERWYRAGPARGSTWEYHAARQANPTRFDDEITLDDRPVDLARTVVGAFADDRRAKLDVAVHHPDFADLSPRARAQATFLTLDWALGEDDVERWIGAVEVALTAPLDAVPAATLGGLLSQLRERWSGERWLLLEGTSRSGTRALATARHPMCRVDHPLLDEHVKVTLPYEADAEGLPTDAAQAQLGRFESHLAERLGDSALLVGFETGSGRRLLHLYGESRHSIAPRLQALLPAYRGPAVPGVTAAFDPGWQETTHLRP
jgi:DNA-binding MarR family transcriptional regulator